MAQSIVFPDERCRLWIGLLPPGCDFFRNALERLGKTNWQAVAEDRAVRFLMRLQPCPKSGKNRSQSAGCGLGLVAA